MAFTSVDSTAAVGATNGNQLNQQDFIKILMTQLTYQDPLKPMDNEQFLAQMAQFSTLGLMQQQNDKADTLLAIQSAAQTVGLLGHSVQMNTTTGTQIGTVNPWTVTSQPRMSRTSCSTAISRNTTAAITWRRRPGSTLSVAGGP